MKKQGNFYTSVILWIFLIAVVCYFGYYIFSAVYSPLTTAAAIEYEAGAGSYTTGFVVRNETVVRSDYGITTMVVSEGERVSKGQTLATGYRTSGAQERQLQIEQLENQLDQLEYASNYSAEAADQALLDAEIQGQLINLSQYVARRDMNSADDHSVSLKGLILRRMSSEEENKAMDDRIEALRTELDTLRSQSSGDTMAVTADNAGYYSGTVDGYESVLTVDSLKLMTVNDFRSIETARTPDDTVGKLITGSTWYYVTVVPTIQTRDVQVGDEVPVTFASDFYDDLVMEVYHLGDDENDSRLLVLASDQYMQDATLLRQQSADVVFTSYKGLRVPKEAVRVNEKGDPGVYILEGSTASWKNIHILLDNGESYVVELDKSETTNLWPGDEIIVGAKNLYDGKVVR